jgi:hypothetical protein
VSGGYFVVGRCHACGRVFSFHPHRVPSVPIDPVTALPLDVDEHGKTKPIDPVARARAVRQPICEDCIELVNERRVARGDEPIRVLAGAYDMVEGLPE